MIDISEQEIFVLRREVTECGKLGNLHLVEAVRRVHRHRLKVGKAHNNCNDGLERQLPHPSDHSESNQCILDELAKLSHNPPS